LNHLGTKTDYGPYSARRRQHLKGGLQATDLTTRGLHLGEEWLRER